MSVTRSFGQFEQLVKVSRVILTPFEVELQRSHELGVSGDVLGDVVSSTLVVELHRTRGGYFV